MKAINTMSTSEKLNEIDSLRVQLGILNDQKKRIAELGGLIEAGDRAIARLESMGTVGRKSLIASFAAKIAGYRAEKSELEALFA